MYDAQSGMFDHRLIPIAPSGAMSPVETSSPTTIVTRPEIVSGTGQPGGGATMLSGRGISTLAASSASGGATIWRSSTSGRGCTDPTSGGSPSVRGSVIAPRSAVAAAVAGEQR
jgi:hypothetical protein